MRKVIVTIGREFGSGGREIGIKLSEKLGIPFYDKELILHTAEKTNLEESIVEKYDEQHSFPTFSSSNIFDIYQMPMSDRIYIAQADVIHDIAEKESCIIVGRCADFILDKNPDVFKVFITAVPFALSSMSLRLQYGCLLLNSINFLSVVVKSKRPRI